MKILFDPAQAFRADAIRAVVDLFAGQRPVGGAFEAQPVAVADELVTELGAGNRLDLTAEQLEANLRAVQARTFAGHTAELRAELAEQVQSHYDAGGWLRAGPGGSPGRRARKRVGGLSRKFHAQLLRR